MNTMYDAVMKMEQLLGVYERLIDDLAGYMKENGIDYTNDCLLYTSPSPRD